MPLKPRATKWQAVICTYVYTVLFISYIQLQDLRISKKPSDLELITYIHIHMNGFISTSKLLLDKLRKHKFMQNVYKYYIHTYIHINDEP